MKRTAGPDGPGFWQLDGSLFKRFGLGGSRYGEFRVDAYNVTNSVRWANPNVGFSTATGNTFGQITGTNGSQRSHPVRRAVRLLGPRTNAEDAERRLFLGPRTNAEDAERATIPAVDDAEELLVGRTLVVPERVKRLRCHGC